MIPNVKFTKSDGNTGVVKPAADGILCVIAPCEKGTKNQPVSYTRAALAVANFGDGELSEMGAYNLDVSGKPTMFIRANASTPGAYGAISGGVASAFVTGSVSGPFNLEPNDTLLIAADDDVSGPTYTTTTFTATAAARESGLHGLPDPTASIASELTRPAGGIIEETVPNRSEGARLILAASAAHGNAIHPLAIVTGGALTDVADAYLMDPTLAERAVVVASLGQNEGEGAETLDPNGSRDPWATVIVTSRMRYVQVNGYYDQLLDLPQARVAELPNNAFGRWMAGKRTDILNILHACDQVSVLAVTLPWFALDVARLRPDGAEATSLIPEPNGQIWHVARTDSDRARDEIWARLKSATTFQ